jgi:hypothetical protein
MPEDQIESSGSKERVAYDLMNKISVIDPRMRDSIRVDPASYYLHLYEACFDVVCGRETADNALKTASKR